MSIRKLAICLATGVAFMSAGGAHAALLSGSAILFGIRDCQTPTGSCFVGPSVTTQYIGLANGGTSAGVGDGIGDFGSGRAGAGPTYLPDIGASSQSSAARRMGVNAISFATFTYTGSTAIDLGLDLNYHYITSGSIDGDTLVQSPNEGVGDAFIFVDTLDAVAGLDSSSTGKQIYQALFGPGQCGASGIGQAYANTGGTVGEHTISVAATGCNGGSIVIQPGETFIVGGLMQAISDRSGFIDASHTLTAAFDPSHTYFDGTQTAVGADFLESHLFADVPEPSTWALMLLGLGGLGASLRRSKARASALHSHG